MPARAATPLGAPIWNDVSATDVEASARFYGALFGWKHTSYGDEFGGYGSFFLDGQAVAGIGSQMSPDAPITWTVYLNTPDVAATVERVMAAGGRVLAPAMPVEGKGVMAIVADPAGAVFGLWQPNGMDGFEVVAEANTPVWHEVFSKDYAAAVAFYRDVLGWEIQVQGDTDEFRYCVLAQGEMQYAGAMDASRLLPENVPSHWRTYFGVPDTDVAVRRAVELGASVVEAAQGSAYGRSATLADPQGAVFNIISVQEAG